MQAGSTIQVPSTVPALAFCTQTGGGLGGGATFLSGASVLIFKGRLCSLGLQSELLVLHSRIQKE